jgi:hypothetical protein
VRIYEQLHPDAVNSILSEAWPALEHLELAVTAGAGNLGVTVAPYNRAPVLPANSRISHLLLIGNGGIHLDLSQLLSKLSDEAPAGIVDIVEVSFTAGTISGFEGVSTLEAIKLAGNLLLAFPQLQEDDPDYVLFGPLPQYWPGVGSPAADAPDRDLEFLRDCSN